MLKEADLKDLQTRYQQIQEVNENQHKLLDQLSERLQMAAQYFHELSDKNKALEEANKKQKKIPWFSRKRFFLKHNNDQAGT